MPSRPSVRASILAAILALAACKSDSMGPAIPLTQAETAQMFSELSSAISGVNIGLSLVRDPRGGPSFALVPGPRLSTKNNVTVNATVNCANGGTASAAGSFSSSGTTTVTTSSDVTFTFNACKTTDFTIGGSLHFFGSSTTTATTIQLSETVQGTLTVDASNGRSGSCAIDFTITASGPIAGPTISASGSICGISANGTVT